MNRSSITELLDAARLQGLTATPGGRIVASVSSLNAKGNAYRTRLHEYDTPVTDDAPVPAPLTRGSASVGAVALMEDGTTLFTAKRVGEDGSESDDAQLWALPARGEARELANRPGGFGGLHLGDGVLIAEIGVHSQATNEAEHRELSQQRKDAGVTAALHADFPTRFWDHDLGPARQILAVADLPEDLMRAEATPDPDASSADSDSAQAPSAAGTSATGASAAGASVTGPSAATDSDTTDTGEDEADETASTSVLHFRHIPMPAGRLIDWSVDRAGRHALVTMGDSWDDLLGATRMYLLDLTGAAEPILIDETTPEREELFGGEFSRDGSRAVVARVQNWWLEGRTLHPRLEILDIATRETTPLWPEFDHWATPTWLDDSTIVATSDDTGRGSVWIGGVDDPAPRRLAGGPEQDLSFSGLAVAGDQLVAVASGIIEAPRPILIDPDTGTITDLPQPADEVQTVGSLTEVTAHGEDGTEVRAWLCLPDGEGPHPLVVFAHGGPWGSWNAWTWRWNPQPFVASGYAVLLPDPAISTGYGQEMIERGQHELGGAPFTDIMALTDATIARPDIDAERTAFSGGSYGGYMANWVAGHTGDRFRCIVTHASLWDTETMGTTTDNAGWEAPMRDQNPTYNPKRYVENIVVPMLVIHGDKDYRVPIAQGQALWYDLNTFSQTPRDEQGRTRHRYLYFPDEGHWILGRGNAQVWYETFLAFLDEHVLGEVGEQPATLG